MLSVGLGLWLLHAAQCFVLLQRWLLPAGHHLRYVSFVFLRCCDSRFVWRLSLSIHIYLRVSPVCMGYSCGPRWGVNRGRPVLRGCERPPVPPADPAARTLAAPCGASALVGRSGHPPPGAPGSVKDLGRECLCCWRGGGGCVCCSCRQSWC